MKKHQIKIEKRLMVQIFIFAMLLVVQGVLTQAKTSEPREKKAESNVTPKNPVHHCTKDNFDTDITDWDYVYFGSYPQKEIKGDALTAEIKGAAYNTNGDAKVHNTKYRRVSVSDTNDDKYFGKVKYRYFKWEPIKWRVLYNDGSKLFVMADKGMDCKAYHSKGGDITWEDSTLRNWLNKDFYEMAFSSSEQKAIQKRNVLNEDNPTYGTEAGENTKDKVFLLSVKEALNPDYGFCEEYDTYSVSRRVEATDYAHAMGAYINTKRYQGNCWWWLRSPGYTNFHAVHIGSYGVVYEDADYNDAKNKTCVPAVYLDLNFSEKYLQK